MKTKVVNKPNILVYNNKTIKSVALNVAIGTKVHTNDKDIVIQTDSREELINLSKNLELISGKDIFKEFSI